MEFYPMILIKWRKIMQRKYLYGIVKSQLKYFKNGSVVKNLLANVGDPGSILGSERSPGEGNGNPFKYSCLGNPVDRGAWPAIVCGVTEESDTI